MAEAAFDESAIARIKQPLARGRAYQRAGQWAAAARAYEEAVTIEEAKERPRRNPFARTFPGGGYRLDGRHRVAFALAMDRDMVGARSAWLDASRTDEALASWVDRFGHLLQQDSHRTTATSLWRLIDDTPAMEGEAAALALIQSARDPEVLPESWWFVAYVHLYRQGWPRAAYAAKAQASMVARRSSAPPSTILDTLRCDTATAFADAGDLPTAQSYLNGHQTDEARELAIGLARLAANTNTAAALGANAGRDDDDERFCRLVAGRSIAIVAPGNTGIAHGAEIDAFDLVVRTNFRAHETISAHAPLIGTRTDVTYFNGNFEPENREEILTSLRERPLSFAVMRFDDPEALALYRAILPVRVGTIFNPYYRMNAYAVPKIVHDLSRFGPARIKIFNADFFLGDAPHYSGYLNYDIKLVQSFLGHDVLRNFRLVQKWFRAGIVEADDVLTAILNLSEDEVINRVAKRLAAPEGSATPQV
ncbi:MAG: hypothetical protein ACT6QU_06435 [Aliihoeflea sp.]|uniref:hypothetical protein n=1 Tax=Aliihoeflea sp. TaxID=2608088 RepID=UPI0040332B22